MFVPLPVKNDAVKAFTAQLAVPYKNGAVIAEAVICDEEMLDAVIFEQEILEEMSKVDLKLNALTPPTLNIPVPGTKDILPPAVYNGKYPLVPLTKVG